MSSNIKMVDSFDTVSLNPLTTPSGIAAPTQISDSQCSFGGFELNNNDAAVRYLQVWFKPVASVILGTTPPDLTFAFASSGTLSRQWFYPFKKGNGLTMACTTTETGTTTATLAMTGAVEIKK